MKQKADYLYLTDYLEERESEGMYSFTFSDLLKNFSVRREALKAALNRLVRKGRIVSVRKGSMLQTMNEIKNGGDRRSCYEKTEAYKAGYKTIADIGKKSESGVTQAGEGLHRNLIRLYPRLWSF
jgi:DNA-binding transcriptional regulator PaaX